MSQWPGELHPGQFPGDRARLTRSDPDREQSITVYFLEDDNGGFRDLIEPEALHSNFNHDRRLTRSGRRPQVQQTGEAIEIQVILEMVAEDLDNLFG